MNSTKEMEAPSNSSRKRPLEAMAGATIGDAINTSFTCNDDMLHTKNTSLTMSCNVSTHRDGEDRNEDCPSKSDCDTDSEEEDGDIAEIIELQKALEYLVSERDIKYTYNHGDMQKQQLTAQSHSHTTTTKDANDVTHQQNEQLCMIPNLVNRIIMEHYTPTNQKHEHTIRDIQ